MSKYLLNFFLFFFYPGISHSAVFTVICKTSKHFCDSHNFNIVQSKAHQHCHLDIQRFFLQYLQNEICQQLQRNYKGERLIKEKRKTEKKKWARQQYTSVYIEDTLHYYYEDSQNSKTTSFYLPVHMQQTPTSHRHTLGLFITGYNANIYTYLVYTSSCHHILA